jgi:hypothetical protein
VEGLKDSKVFVLHPVQEAGGLRRVYPTMCLPIPLRLILGTVTPVDTDSIRGVPKRRSSFSGIKKNGQ